MNVAHCFKYFIQINSLHSLIMWRTVGFCCLLLMCSLQNKRGADASEVLPRCPTQHMAGDTYEVLDVFQSYPVDRRDTNQESPLTHTCYELSGSRELLHIPPGDRYVQVSKPCHSVLRNCRYDESMGNRASFCVSLDPRRRYDFMDIGKRDEKIRYGSTYTKDCPSSRLEVYDSSLFIYYPCLCDCETPLLQTDRHFGLEDAVADDGKVVTGLRFRKIDHVFHIQIQQGQLGPNRTIVGEVEWKAISGNNSELMGIPELAEDIGASSIMKFYDRDWTYTVSNNQNVVLLDNLVAEPDEVLTGFRFYRVVGTNDLRLEVKVTRLNEETEKLATGSSRWLHNAIDKNMRKEVKLSVSNGAFNVPSTGHQFVKFQVSDFKTDLGQTTVPFIDMRDVVPETPRPFSGAGIFLEESPGLAGLIALKLF